MLQEFFHLTSLLIMIKVSLSNVDIFSYISLTLLFDVAPQIVVSGLIKNEKEKYKHKNVESI